MLYEFWTTKPGGERYLTITKSGDSSVDVYNQIQQADTEQDDDDLRFNTLGSPTIVDFGVKLTDGQIGPDDKPTSWDVNVISRHRTERHRFNLGSTRHRLSPMGLRRSVTSPARLESIGMLSPLFHPTHGNWNPSAMLRWISTMGRWFEPMT